MKVVGSFYYYLCARMNFGYPGNAQETTGILNLVNDQVFVLLNAINCILSCERYKLPRGV